MDNHELSLSAPPAQAVPVAQVTPGAYPSHASAHPGAEPVRRREPVRRGATAAAHPVRSLRKRISSILAAIGAAIAKFFAAIKGFLLLLPKLKLLTTSGTALVSVAAYSLFWGWEFAAGFVVLMFVHEMGHVIALRREGHQGERADVHPVPGRGDLLEVAGRQRAGGGARGAGGPDPGQPRRRLRWRSWARSSAARSCWRWRTSASC